jgi:hypothetical protein
MTVDYTVSKETGFVPVVSFTRNAGNPTSG